MIPGVPFKRGQQSAYSIKSLQRDPNCVLLQDPSAIWGGADHLPRRNLLGYTEDFSNAAWAKTDSTATTSSLITEGSAANAIVKQTVTLSGNLVFSVELTRGNTDFVRLQVNRSDTDYMLAWVNLSTGTLGTVRAAGSGVISSSTIASNGSGGYTVTLTGSAGIGAAYVGINTSTVDNGAARVSGGTYSATKWSLSLASTTDQSYQKITDWVSEQYAWAAQKNVPWLRRNMLGYTEGAFNNTTYFSKNQIGNSSIPVITDNYADGPLPGSRASRAIFARTGTTASDYSTLFSASVSIPVGQQEYFSIYVKSNTGSDQTFILYGANDSGTTPRTFTATSSWQRFYAGSAGGPATGRVIVIGTRGGSGQYYTGGDLSLDLQICCVQLSVANCDYQRITTTWPAEYTALALAAGFPISLYSDRAGTTATYGPDDPVGVLLDGSEGYALGTELVTNGSGSTLTGWTTNVGSGSTVESVGGEIHCVSTGNAASIQQNVLTAGDLCLVTFSCRVISGILKYSLGGAVETQVSSTQTVRVLTTASGPGFYINRYNACEFYLSNISIKKIPGYHATAPSDAARPNLRLDGNGKWYLDRDTTDDNLPITWPTNLTTTGVVYTATGDYTTKDSGLILSGATNYTTPQRPSGDYGRIVMASESKYDAKIIKYLDAKRGRSYQLGPELYASPGFDDSASWTKEAGWTVSGGLARFNGSAAGSNVYQASIVTAGKTYLTIIDVASVTTPGGGIRFRLGAATWGITRQSTGVYSEIITAATTGISGLYTITAAATDISVNSISIREILL